MHALAYEHGVARRGAIQLPASRQPRTERTLGDHPGTRFRTVGGPVDPLYRLGRLAEAHIHPQPFGHGRELDVAVGVDHPRQDSAPFQVDTRCVGGQRALGVIAYGYDHPAVDRDATRDRIVVVQRAYTPAKQRQAAARAVRHKARGFDHRATISASAG